MKKIIPLFILIAIAFIIIIFFIKPDFIQSNIKIDDSIKPNFKQSNLIDQDIELFYPLFAANLPNGSIEKYLGYQKNGEDYINYFTTSGIALESLLRYNVQKDEELLKNALQIVDNNIRTYKNNGYFPRPAYHDFEDGWVSSMDAPLIALTALVAFELTGNNKYYDFYLDLIPNIIKKNSEKGFLLKLSENALFPLEYCNTNTTDEDAFYVLNGSLVGYLSLAFIAETYGHKEIINLIEKIDNAYTIKFPEYIMNIKHWTFYMLNKQTVNQGHYQIFELKLFSSIYKLTKKELFKKEYETRQNILKEIYDLKVEIKKDSLNYYFLRSTAPHPYQIELYGTSLKFYDKANQLIQEDSRLASGHMPIEKFNKNSFMSGTISNEAYKYELISKKGGIETILFEEKINDYVVDTDIDLVQYTLSASQDAKIEDDNLNIAKDISKDGWASVFLNFEQPVNLDYLKYYFIEIDYGIKDVNMQLTIYDNERKSIHRTIPTLIDDKNLVLFSPLGFHSNNVLSNIKKLRIRFYTDAKGFKDDNNIKINNFGILDNEYEVIKYLKETKYKINSER